MTSPSLMLRRRTTLLASALLAFTAAVVAPTAVASTPTSRLAVPADEMCTGPVADAEPGTAAWTERDLQNQRCAEQRLLDSSVRPPLEASTSPSSDPLREPERHAGTRFRYDAVSVPNRAGVQLPAEIYRPCTASTCRDVPPGVQVADGPYATVVIVHGGASRREHMRWAAQALAEHGYMTVAFDVAENGGGDHATDAQDVLDWLFAQESPVAGSLDRGRVGIAGHSQGASTASLLGQLDPRLQTIVAWDNLTAVAPELWSDDLGVDPPADLRVTKPALGIGADYYFVPRPYADRPEPAQSNGEGGRGRGFSAHPKDLGFQELKAARVDTMLHVLRAGTHLEFTPLQVQAASRYGEAVATYLTLAWFDAYLRGLTEPALARNGFDRLVAAYAFDDSADVHNISLGTYDAVDGDRPHLVEGLSTCDRMSFLFRSRYRLTVPGTDRVVGSDNLRADCYAGDLPPATRSSAPRGQGAVPRLPS